MTPQKKAIELVEKYGSVDLQPYSEFGDYMIHEATKQCALIAVDEITEALENEENVYLLDSSYIDFWNEVKQEIEKL